MRRKMVRIMVDLPEPDRPMSTKNSPCFTSNEISRMPSTRPVSF